MWIKQADWGKTPQFLPWQLQVTFPQSSKQSTGDTVHQRKGCAGGFAWVSDMSCCHCVQKQELSQRGSFPLLHSPSPTRHTLLGTMASCQANEVPCKHPVVFAVSGQLQHGIYYHNLLSTILLCFFFSFFLYLLPKLHILIIVSLSPSCIAAAEFLHGLEQSRPATLSWMHHFTSVTYSPWMK